MAVVWVLQGMGLYFVTQSVDFRNSGKLLASKVAGMIAAHPPL